MSQQLFWANATTSDYILINFKKFKNSQYSDELWSYNTGISDRCDTLRILFVFTKCKYLHKRVQPSRYRLTKIRAKSKSH